MRITYRKLIIIIAKEIKLKNRLNKQNSLIKIRFTISHDDGKTFIHVDDNTYFVDGNYDDNNILSDALNECSIDGYVDKDDDGFYVIIFGKPTKEFIKLSRVIEKSCGFKLDKKDIYTEYPKNPKQERNYLCYNPISCMEALGFIKHNKKNNHLQVNIENNNQSFNGRSVVIGVVNNKNKIIASHIVYY